MTPRRRRWERCRLRSGGPAWWTPSSSSGPAWCSPCHWKIKNKNVFYHLLTLKIVNCHCKYCTRSKMPDSNWRCNLGALTTELVHPQVVFFSSMKEISSIVKMSKCPNKADPRYFHWQHGHIFYICFIWTSVFWQQAANTHIEKLNCKY